MTTDRFAQIKSQYRRWPEDADPNGNWGADVSWLIDEVEALRVQLAERDEYYRLVINENCQQPDEKHCTCVPALRAEVGRLRVRLDDANKLAEMMLIITGPLCESEEAAQARKILHTGTI